MKTLIALSLLLIAHTTFAEISTPIRGTLDNGLDYAILPLHDDKGRLEIRLRVEAGGVDETDTQAGVAHMVEHLVFKTSDKHPRGVMNHLHESGFVRAKNYNAITTPYDTTYLFTPPADVGLDESLSALSQMMFFAHLTQADLDKERHIITEEWRGGQGVSAVMDQQRKSVIRADSRYVRSPVIGTKQSIATMPATELQKFYQTWYAPNNMNLLIVGDVNAEDTKATIEKYFGQTPSRTLPERTGDYYEVKLSDKIAIKELHDERSGVSQIAYIVRFDEQGSRGDTPTARKNRLIDRIALTFITKRLQNEMTALPTGIKSVVVRKSDIGKNTVALGVFSSVDKDNHREGLAEIFKQIKRLHDYPISQSEFDDIKKDLQAQLDKAYTHKNDRDFAGWVQAMAGTVLVDKPYLTQSEIAHLTQPILESLTTADISERVADWFAQTDRIVQYQSPHHHRISALTHDEVVDMMIQANTTTTRPPTPKPTQTAIEPPHAPTTAHITSMTTHQRPQGVVRKYTLSTGERVLWLNTPHMGDKTDIRIISGAGTQANELNAWHSQLASQLIMQSVPPNINKATWDYTKKAHHLSLSAKQNSHELVIDLSGDNRHLDTLINFYHAQMYHAVIDEIALNDVKTALHSQLNPQGTHQQQEKNRNDEIAKLRQLPPILPTTHELDNLSTQELQHEWQKMTHTPATIYIISNATPAVMGQFIPRLANPHTNLIAFTHAPTPLASTNTVKFPHHLENRSDVKLWTSTPYTWQGVDAMLVSILKTIATDKLKLTLRDEKLGIYKLSFDSTLNPQNAHIESTLSFTTSPDKADEMIASAKEVLANLPHLISEQDVAKARTALISQEKSRQNDRHTLMNRLILSDKYSDDLAYLSQVHELPTHLTLTNLQRLAKDIYNPDSVQVWVDMPKDK